MSQQNRQSSTASKARPLSTQSFLSRSSSVRRFHGLLFNTHSRSTSDSGVFTPPTRRDSITPQTIPLETANPRPLSTIPNTHRLSTISNASTVSSTIPFPDFDSSFEPPREEDECDTGESDHGSQEAEDEEGDGDDDSSEYSSEDGTSPHRPLFSTQELAEMSAFYGVTVTGKGRLSFDFGASDNESSAGEVEVPVQEAQDNQAVWRRKFSRSTNSTSSGFRRSVLGSIKSEFSGKTGSSHRRRLVAMLTQGMRNTFISGLAGRTDLSSLQYRYPALFNQGARGSYLAPASEYSDVSEESSVAPSVTSSMYSRRFEHILGPGVRDSWMSGLFTMNFGEWNKDEDGEEEELEPIPEPCPYPEFDEETAAKVVSFLNTIGRDTQLINRRLKVVLAESKWVGISGQHGLLYLQKPDMRYDEVVSIYEKLGQHMNDLQEQLVAIKGFDVGFDDTLRSWLIDERELKDVVPVVEMYEEKYKTMMEEFAAKKVSIMQEAVEEKKLLLPKVAEMRKEVEEELAVSKKAFIVKVAEKVRQKEELSKEELAEQRMVLQLDYGVQYLSHIMDQIEDEMVAESVADTESEYDPWPSNEEDAEEEIHDEDRDYLSGTESESIEGFDGAPENWSDLDEYESTDDDSEDGSNEDESSEDDEVNEIDDIQIHSSEDESNGYDSDDEDSSDNETDEIMASGDESSGYESSDEESSDQDEEAEALDVRKPEFTAEEWASGVLEAERRGIVFNPFKMTVEEDQEIVLGILRSRRDVDSSLATEQVSARGCRASSLPAKFSYAG